MNSCMVDDLTLDLPTESTRQEKIYNTIKSTSFCIFSRKIVRASRNALLQIREISMKNSKLNRFDHFGSFSVNEGNARV